MARAVEQKGKDGGHTAAVMKAPRALRTIRTALAVNRKRRVNGTVDLLRYSGCNLALVPTPRFSLSSSNHERAVRVRCPYHCCADCCCCATGAAVERAEKREKREERVRGMISEVCEGKEPRARSAVGL